jgi:hypothetical protein
MEGDGRSVLHCLTMVSLSPWRITMFYISFIILSDESRQSFIAKFGGVESGHKVLFEGISRCELMERESFVYQNRIGITGSSNKWAV